MEKIIAANTQALIDKLNSISNDLKYYINVNVDISRSDKSYPIIPENMMDELLNVRNRIKIISKELSQELHQ